MSLTYFERALDMMQKKYGHDSAQLISVYQSLGRVSFLACVERCIVHKVLVNWPSFLKLLELHLNINVMLSNTAFNVTEILAVC